MKNASNTLINIVMMISICAGAIFSSHNPPLWLEFGISMVVLLGTIILQKVSIKNKLKSHDHDKFNLKGFSNLLEELQFEAETILIKKNDYSDEELIDEFEEKINVKIIEFEKYHQTLKALLKLTTFTDLITAYANAERYFNRAYSAAIDGYKDAAMSSLKDASEFIKMAAQVARKENF